MTVTMYGAAPYPGPWPRPFIKPAEPQPVPARFELPPAPLPASAADGVRAVIQRLVALRLSKNVRSPAVRAEIDSLIGALTVALGVDGK